MGLPKKLSMVAIGLTTAGSVAVAAPASAQTPVPASQISSKQHAKLTLDAKSGTAVDLETQLDCNSHTLTAQVTNKTDAKITPTVTFNKHSPSFPVVSPIDPGKTASYTYNFSGNRMMIDVKVAVSGHDDLTSAPLVSCLEPVSFRVDQTSESAVTGYLSNNSSLVPITVLTRVNSGDVRTETLAAGETRLIAMPYKGYDNQTFVGVTIGTTEGYEGTYNINLDEPVVRPVDTKQE